MNDDPVQALMRDIERLRAYAEYLESNMGNGEICTLVMVREWREEHGVADLMRGDDTPQPPGASGLGE